MVTVSPASSSDPPDAGADPSGKTIRLPFFGLPNGFSPGSSQKRPTRVSQPSSRFKLAILLARQLSISDRWASGEGAAASSTAKRRAPTSTRLRGGALEAGELLG